MSIPRHRLLQLKRTARAAVIKPLENPTKGLGAQSLATMATMSESQHDEPRGVKRKLHGRDFYRSIGSPKYVLAPMVDQSEFAWRMLTRSFMSPEENQSLLAYTPMFHARMFSETPKYRQAHFQPLKEPLPSPPDEHHRNHVAPDLLSLDGNPSIDRPLFVQFCANEPKDFLSAAQHVAAYCDAVDLNLGCPQGIARKGRYGAFLQEDWPTINRLLSTLNENLTVPVTAKFRIQESREKTLEYAKMILAAGASIITVHGRQRDQKGHNTGLADWSVIRFLRDNLPPETVIFANGNILQHEDIEECLRITGADGVMSAEGNLYDPSIFATPPAVGQEGREYWRGADGKGGWRMDAALRRYLDIMHRYVLGQEPPTRRPLYIPADGEVPKNKTDADDNHVTTNGSAAEDTAGPALTKKQQRKQKTARSTPVQKFEKGSDSNFTAMQAHLFHMLRPLVARHTDIRDKLARVRAGDLDAFEQILAMVERVVAEGIRDAAKVDTQGISAHSADYGANNTNGNTGNSSSNAGQLETSIPAAAADMDPHTSSLAAVERCKRPWFVCQPYVRPLPKEAVEKGALMLSKKEKKRLELEAQEAAALTKAGAPQGKAEERVVGSDRVVGETNGDGKAKRKRSADDDADEATRKRTSDGAGKTADIARDGLVCG